MDSSALSLIGSSVGSWALSSVDCRAVGVFAGGEATATPSGERFGGLMGRTVGAFVD